VAIKLANAGISPIFQAGLRSAGSALLVWAWSAHRGVRLFARDGTLGLGILIGVLFGAESDLHQRLARGALSLHVAFRRSVGRASFHPRRAAALAIAFLVCEPARHGHTLLALHGKHCLATQVTAWSIRDCTPGDGPALCLRRHGARLRRRAALADL
jgi:hypothetical protein